MTAIDFLAGRIRRVYTTTVGAMCDLVVTERSKPAWTPCALLPKMMLLAFADRIL